jgi:hypothetical protein
MQGLEKDPKTTHDLLTNVPIDLVVFPNMNNIARGSLYIDKDGETYSDWENTIWQYYEFLMSSTDAGFMLRFTRSFGIDFDEVFTSNQLLNKVTIVQA